MAKEVKEGLWNSPATSISQQCGKDGGRGKRLQWGRWLLNWGKMRLSLEEEWREEMVGEMRCSRSMQSSGWWW